MCVCLCNSGSSILRKLKKFVENFGKLATENYATHHKSKCACLPSHIHTYMAMYYGMFFCKCVDICVRLDRLRNFALQTTDILISRNIPREFEQHINIAS